MTEWWDLWLWPRDLAISLNRLITSMTIYYSNKVESNACDVTQRYGNPCQFLMMSNPNLLHLTIPNTSSSHRCSIRLRSGLTKQGRFVWACEHTW